MFNILLCILFSLPWTLSSEKCSKDSCYDGQACLVNPLSGKVFCQCSPFQKENCIEPTIQEPLCDIGWTHHKVENATESNNYKLNETLETCVKIFNISTSYQNASLQCQREGGWLLGVNDSALFTTLDIFTEGYKELWAGIIILTYQNESRIYTHSSFPKKFKDNYITLPSDYNKTTDCPYFRFDNQPTILFDDCESSSKIFACEKRKYYNSDLTTELNICPTGWFYSFVNNKCIKYMRDEVEFEQAKQACTNFKAHLAWPISAIGNFALLNATIIALNSIGCGVNAQCRNEGKCSFNDSIDNPGCICASGFSGQQCQNYTVGTGIPPTYASCPIGTYSLNTCPYKCHCFNDQPCDNTNGYCPNFKCKDNFYGLTCDASFKVPNAWIGVTSTNNEGFVYTNGISLNMDTIGFTADKSSTQIKQCHTISEDWYLSPFKIWKKYNCTERKTYLCEKDSQLDTLSIQIQLKRTDVKSSNSLGIGCRITKAIDKLAYRDIYWEVDGSYHKFAMLKYNDLYVIDTSHEYFINEIGTNKGRYRCMVDLPYINLKSNALSVNQKSTSIILALIYNSVTKPTSNVITITNITFENAIQDIRDLSGVSLNSEIINEFYLVDTGLYAAYMKFIYDNSTGDVSLQRAFYLTRKIIQKSMKNYTLLLENLSVSLSDTKVYPMNMCPPIFESADNRTTIHFPSASFGDTIFSEENCLSGKPRASRSCTASPTLKWKGDWEKDIRWNCEPEISKTNICPIQKKSCRPGNLCIEDWSGYTCQCSEIDNKCDVNHIYQACPPQGRPHEFWELSGYHSGYYCLNLEQESNFSVAEEICQKSFSWIISVAGDHNDQAKLLSDKLFDLGVGKNMWISMKRRNGKLRTRFSTVLDVPDIFKNITIPNFDNQLTCLFVDGNVALNDPDGRYQIYSNNCSEKLTTVCERRATFNYELLSDSPLCSKGWFFSFYYHKCRKFFSEPKSFKTANDTCYKHGAILNTFSTSDATGRREASNLTLLEMNMKGCGLNNQCLNRGKCLFKNEKFVGCDCLLNTTGSYCEKSTEKLWELNSCPTGRYSTPYCDKICNCKNNASCDVETGKCPSFLCDDGFYGPTCSSYFKLPNLWWKGNSMDCCIIGHDGEKCGSCDLLYPFVCEKDPESEDKFDLPVVEQVKDPTVFDPGLVCKIPDYYSQVLSKTIYWIRNDQHLYYRGEGNLRLMNEKKYSTLNISDDNTRKIVGRIEGNYTCIIKFPTFEIASNPLQLTFTNKKYVIRLSIPDYNLKNQAKRITEVQYLFWNIIANETIFSNSKLLLEIEEPIQEANNVTVTFYVHLDAQSRIRRSTSSNQLPQYIMGLSEKFKNAIMAQGDIKTFSLATDTLKAVVVEFCEESFLYHPISWEIVSFPKTETGNTADSVQKCSKGGSIGTRVCSGTTWQDPIWQDDTLCFDYCSELNSTYPSNPSISVTFPRTLEKNSTNSVEKCEKGLFFGAADCLNGAFQSFQWTSEKDCFFYCPTSVIKNPITGIDVTFPETKSNTNVSSNEKCKTNIPQGTSYCSKGTFSTPTWLKEADCFIYCNEESVKNPKTSLNTTFPKIRSGATVNSLENCTDGVPEASRYCSDDGWEEVIWTEAEDCTVLTTMLKNLSKTAITEDNIDTVTQQTVDLTLTSNLTSNHITLVSTIVENVKESDIETTKEIFENIVTIVSNVLASPLKSIVQSQSKSNSSTNFVEAIDYFSEKAILPENQTFLNVETSQIALTILNGKNIDFNTFSFENINRYDKNIKNITLNTSLTTVPTDLELINYGIYFADVFKIYPNKRVIAAIYANAKFFERSEETITESKVISASIGNQTVVNLKNNITLIFQPNNETIKNGYDCVFWNFKKDNWSSDGCQFEKEQNGRVFCTCNHFTNFALLFDPDREDDTPEFISFISMIGLGISIAGYLGVIISFGFVKEWKPRVSLISSCNISIAFIAVNIMFMVGIKRTDNQILCTATSAILFYAFLVAFLSMFFNSFLQYCVIRNLLHPFNRNFIGTSEKKTPAVRKAWKDAMLVLTDNLRTNSQVNLTGQTTDGVKNSEENNMPDFAKRYKGQKRNNFNVPNGGYGYHSPY
ncbi:DgyrCDS2583 [Dimorphilus gyrociliatus]|uniref:DgyrCDS2583 n=1 Tax=Dimorphilus gyrociliatus TaxID=2664684 RepID=A0A7I8VAQ0_9ANNE|nr:DgyrCDS2583 [Dimorphilus gyrociliatus]